MEYTRFECSFTSGEVGRFAVNMATEGDVTAVKRSLDVLLEVESSLLGLATPRLTEFTLENEWRRCVQVVWFKEEGVGSRHGA